MAESINTIPDGQLDFSGGQDASRAQDKVPENAVYKAVNVSFNNGNLGPRTGVHKRKLNYVDGRISYDGKLSDLLSSIFRRGKFQAVIPYAIENKYYIIMVVTGLVYLIDIDTYKTEILRLPNQDRLNQYAPRLNWSNEAEYVVIHDYPNKAVLIKGRSIRRAEPSLDEVPISVMSAYNQNRMWITNAVNEYTAGDPTGSASAPDAPITFKEINTIASPYYGQLLQLPTKYPNDPITALGFLDATDSSTGIGPLILATENQVFSANSQNPRATWEQGQFAGSVISNVGVIGPQAFINVGSDFFFADVASQVRSLSMSRQEQGKWSKVSMSREVKNWIGAPEKSLGKYTALGYFDNKIFSTVNPYRVRAYTLNGDTTVDYVFGGMVVIELANLSKLGATSEPVWAGLWTGVRPMGFVTVGGRFFIVSKDNDATNSLWEMVPETTYDTLDGYIRYVNSTIYTREYSFNDPFKYKSFQGFDASVGDIEGKFKLSLSYKPSNSSRYIDWREFNHEAPWRTCNANDPCFYDGGIESQNLNEIRFGEPDVVACDPVANFRYDWFRKASLKLEITGKNWSLGEFKLRAVPQDQSDTDATPCEGYNVVQVCGGCSSDWAIPELDSCVEKEIYYGR